MELKKLHKACSQKDWPTTATQNYLLLSTSVHRKYLYFSYSSYRSVTEVILASYMPALLPPALLTTSTVPAPGSSPQNAQTTRTASARCRENRAAAWRSWTGQDTQDPEPNKVQQYERSVQK